MAHLAKMDTAQEDARLAKESLGSVLMTLGGVILGMAAILGIYDFVDVREGTHLMLGVSCGLAVIGLVLMAAGEWKRGSVV